MDFTFNEDELALTALAEQIFRGGTTVEQLKAVEVTKRFPEVSSIVCLYRREFVAKMWQTHISHMY